MRIRPFELPRLVSRNRNISLHVVRLNQVDCQEYPLLCSEQFISGYPTLKLYQHHQAKEDYLGGRSTGPITKTSTTITR